MKKFNFIFFLLLLTECPSLAQNQQLSMPYSTGLKQASNQKLTSRPDAIEPTTDMHALEAESMPSQLEAANQYKLFLSLTPISIGYFVFKRGMEAAIIINDKWSIGLEYLTGSLGINILRLDIADFSETLLLVPVRWYPFNGRFYLKTGFGKRQYKLALGDRFLSRNAPVPLHAQLIAMENIVFQLALGHQWRFRNGLLLELVWFEWINALGPSRIDESFTAQSENLRDIRLVRRAIDILQQTPTVAIVKLQLGYHF